MVVESSDTTQQAETSDVTVKLRPVVQYAKHLPKYQTICADRNKVR